MVGYRVPHKSDHQEHRRKSKLSQKGKKKETSPTFLYDDLDFTDIILMGINSIDTDLKRPDDVMNLFNFDKWQSAPVEPFSINSTYSLENVLYETSTDIGLQNIKYLSSLRK